MHGFSGWAPHTYTREVAVSLIDLPQQSSAPQPAATTTLYPAKKVFKTKMAVAEGTWLGRGGDFADFKK